MHSKRLTWPIPALSSLLAAVKLLPAFQEKENTRKRQKERPLCSKRLPWPLPQLSSLSAVVKLLPACKNKKHQEKAKGETVVQQGVAMAITSVVIIVSSC